MGLEEIEEGFHHNWKGESLMAGELRKTILEADDIIAEDVEVPEWDTTVEVRGMSGKERAKLLKGAAAGGEVNMVLFRGRFIDRVVRVDGNRKARAAVF